MAQPDAGGTLMPANPIPDDRRAVSWAELKMVENALAKEISAMQATIASKASLSDLIHFQEVISLKFDHMIREQKQTFENMAKQQARIEWFIYGGVGITLSTVLAGVLALVFRG